MKVIKLFFHAAITVMIFVVLSVARPTKNPGRVKLIDPDRALKMEIEINAPVQKVWWAWTTSEGLKTFFAPSNKIEFRVFGAYDFHFNPNAEAGGRGAEGNIILAIQSEKMLSFTWDAPPKYPDIRKQRTSVVLRFIKLSENRTKLLFTQTGWGEGKDWDEVYNFFIPAWGGQVLPFLKYSLEHRPIDWNNPPSSLPKAKLIQ